MAAQTSPVEAISAEPVIVEASDAQIPAPSEAAEQAVDQGNDEDTKDLSDSKETPGNGRPIAVRSRRVAAPSPVRINTHASRSPPPHPRRRSYYEDDVVYLKNSNTLNELLDTPDIYVETIGRSSSSAYITNHTFHPKDIDKITWLFTIGILDAWIQKPLSYIPASGCVYNLPSSGGQGRRMDIYDDRYDDYERTGITVVNLGSAFRVFTDDSDESQTSKVKFVIAVSGKNSAGWAKLLICYTRQTALSAIFLEILSRNSIAFVGAVLQDVSIPTEPLNNSAQMVFKKATSVQELEEAEEGVIRVIC